VFQGDADVADEEDKSDERVHASAGIAARRWVKCASGRPCNIRTVDQKGDVRLQAIVVCAGAVLMAIKFLAWKVTHSNAILSDALEGIVNVVAGLFALYALVLAVKPRDREYPYGHAKVEFISAGIEGGLVGIAGILIIMRAVIAWLHVHAVHEVEKGITLTAIAGGLNLLIGLVL
jgi:divalent metal cation (Fe/Co/Zn/Cd) transporter